MNSDNSTISSTNNVIHLDWNWIYFCPTGITPWIPNTNNLSPCFQQIILHLPVYTIFAAISSYQYGSFHYPVIRNSTQILSICIRIMITFILALLPILKIFYDYKNDNIIYPIDVLLTCIKCVTWIVHMGFLLSLRKQGKSHRGPLTLLVVWSALFAIDWIWYITMYSDEKIFPWNLKLVILDCLYLISFIPNGDATLIRSRSQHDHEEDALLGHRYTRFNLNNDEICLGHAQDEANILSKSVFYWVEPLITKGIAGKLKKNEDLFDLPDELNINRISDKVHLTISTTKTLFRTLHKSFGKEFYLIGFLRFISDTAGFAGPLLLGGLLSNETTINPYVYALGLFLSTIISAFCGTHFNWRIAIVGMKMRTGIVTAIYSKTLKASSVQDAKPEVLNLMSTDTDRIVNSCISFHTFWSIPFQLFTTLYLLYTQIGSAFIAGLLFALALIPINRLLAVKIQNYSEGLMTSKDARLSATSETINGVKQIKMHSWESIFIDKITELRTEEVKFLSKRKYLDALCVYFWATTPILMCLLTFGVSVLIGNPLTAATTYTSVALLNMLISPLNAFPWVLNGLIEAWVSIKRVQEFLNIPNLEFGSYYETINDESLNDSILEMEQASFSYEKIPNAETNIVFKLDSVNLNIKMGELVCIDGPVGAGKSTLINAIIAGIKCTDGIIRVQNVNDGFGYVSQSPWLQRGTIKENIIWGSVYDESRYKNVIKSCALIEDLEILGGDHVGVGESGHNLSGGQQMRISLARAVYQNKKVYIFDDVLASVDAHVANHIIKNCFLGILKNKTRIIVTSNRTLFFNANQNFEIHEGVVVKKSFLTESFDLSDEELDEIENIQSPLTNFHSTLDEDDKNSLDSVMLEETKADGNINSNVLGTYWRAMSCPIAFTVIFFVLLMQFSKNLSDVWLAHWVAEANKVNNTIEYSKSYYLGVYAAFAIFNSIVTLVRSFIFAYAGIKAAKTIHEKLLNRVLFTKFSFFDITSTGRILNRFSSDTYTVDDSLPFILNILLAQSVGLAGALIIALYAMPWLSLVIIPMIPIYLSLQHRYRHASRDIKRLSSNALSPLYSHFTETLHGLKIIRAMRCTSRFQQDFNVKLEESIKAQLSSCAAQQWLGLRLQFLGSLFVGGAGFLAAFTSANKSEASLVGLVISYALSITGLLGGVLSAFAETEQEMIAVERIDQYLKLDEEDNVDGCLDPPFGWPSQGSVNFNGVYLKYREHLTSSLVDLNLKTEAFERIAIVGRTGAGKSSILAALLRVAPLAAGEISVDCVNISMLSLKILRDRIVIIPQKPFLFEGTVRDNLDPWKKYVDYEIWNAITNCLATTLVQSLGGLNGRLERGGDNLSAGQRQLLCLTRALLKNSKVICIDEGTSNLDSETGTAIQIVLRNSFKSSTIFFVAHRLNGLQNMDRIIVMDFGEIIEQGPPKDLANNPNSIFAKMLQEQGNKDFLI